VELVDGSTLAQLGPPDMRTPIACALAWPERIAWPAPRLDLAGIGRMSFRAPDDERFPALGLARQALAAGGAAPTVFNAANEVAAMAFLNCRTPFLNIAAVVAETLSRAEAKADISGACACETALQIDQEARVVATEVVNRLAAAA
jgi:1-deoxy-D-xylulose 5-phosphate reductoisomerase